MLVWASTQLSGLLDEPARRAVVEELLRRQQPDGGWTLDSLGEWKKHEEAPPSVGSNAYATAFAAFVLEAAGGERTSPKIARALDWLREHQDRESGAWVAESMNKRYETGSMPLNFMRDAATGFAVLALLGR
jgi:squalene-hopene/tetraprenyl-beta-curcumene cyclase